MAYQRPQRIKGNDPIARRTNAGISAMADATTPPVATTLTDAMSSDSVKTGAALALTYHGYKRTGSLVWALIYGAAGKWFPTVAVPVAVAQGFGKRRTCTTEE